MIKILTSKFRDKKKFIINFFILFCSCFFVILGFYILSYFKYCVNSSLNKSIENKTISVDYFDIYDNKKIAKICNLKYVINCYEEYSNWEFKIDGHYLILENVINNNNTLLLRRTIKEKFEIIVSSYIVNNMHYELGDTIIYGDIRLKIVAIIDMESPNVYADTETVRYIANLNKGIVSNVFLVVDKYENTENVINNVNKIGYDSCIVGDPNGKEKNMNEIIGSLKFGVYIVVLISIVIIIVSFLHINNCERKNGALLRLLGYSNVFINIINLLYELLFCLLLFVFYLLLYVIALVIFTFFNFYIISFNTYFNWLFFITIITFSATLVCFCYNYIKSKKMDVLYIVEES